MLQQALHIFRKDARHLRWEIGGSLLLTLLFVLTGIQTWDGIQERGFASDFDGPFNVLFPLIWCLLIARAIHTEALPGDRHFWLTRPYHRSSLVAGKALFVGAFINVPFLVAQLLVVAFSGMPVLSNLGGLLWNQVLITAVVLLPAAMVAALTRNLAQFVPAAVLTVGLLVIPVAEGGRGASRDLDWIRLSIGLLLAVATAVFTLWRQYRLRRSGGSVAFALGSTAVGLLVFLLFPQSAAEAVQSTVVGGSRSDFAMTLAPAAAPGAAKPVVTRYGVFSLPLTISGADVDDLRIGGSYLEIRTLAGGVRRSRVEIGRTEQGLTLQTYLNAEFANKIRTSPVKLEAEFVVSRFGDAQSTSVPLDGSEVAVGGVGQCGAVVQWDRRRFVCRSAFHQPANFVADRVLERSRTDRWWDAYTPFPAQLRIHPVFSQMYEFRGEEAQNVAPTELEAPVTLVAKKPVAYFRYKFEAANVRLADYIPELPKREERP